MKKSYKVWSIAGAAVLLAVLALIAGRETDTVEGTVPDLRTSEVKEGPLWITLTEKGTINASNQVVLPSEVEGTVQVLWLVDESAYVEAGDLLVRLDSSGLKDALVDQQIMEQNAEADYISARENLGVVKNQTKSNTNAAELVVQFAEEDLTKYIEGDFPNELKGAQATLTLAEAELATREEDFEGSQRLFKDDFISVVELNTVTRRLERAQVDLELAQADIDFLQKFTYKRNITQFESDRDESKNALERALLRASADVVQAKALLNARRAEHARESSKREKLEDQIEKTEIFAPVAGRVVYATRSSKRGHGPPRTEPLEEGSWIRERQDVINLRTDNSAAVKITVHESNLGKVVSGLQVRITVDALPGREFTGKVTKVALLPDAQNYWMNPDLKVYGVDIDVDGDWSELRTGMSCMAEVVVERHEKAVYIPTESVLLVDGVPTVYVVKGSKAEKRQVEVGLANDKVIRITANLSPGEMVQSSPPLDSASVAYPSDFVEGIEIPQYDVSDPAEGFDE